VTRPGDAELEAAAARLLAQMREQYGLTAETWPTDQMLSRVAVLMTAGGDRVATARQ
jgi:hypothetical protein